MTGDLENNAPPIHDDVQEAAHLPLARWLRGQIADGTYPPGYRFAPTRELAKRWKTYPLAVHRAFHLLTEENLIERLHRSGTFVRRSASGLDEVLIYLGVDIMANEQLQFYRSVYSMMLHLLLKQEGTKVRASCW